MPVRAGWGVGKATAVLFAREGASVVCGDVNEAAARNTATLIDDESTTALALAGVELPVDGGITLRCA